jgi:hypothetical protein
MKLGYSRQTEELRHSMRLNHLLLCAAISLAFPAAAQACNPIEILFGCRQASVAPAAPAHVRRHELVRYATIHAKRKTGSGKSDAAERQTPLPPPAGVAFASIEHFAADPTLRSGDIVVTPRGFLVFHGDERRFTALDNKHASLASLEKASRRPAAITWQSSSPLAEWSPAVGANPIRDGAGVRTISFAAYR